jgi:phage terminase large subunit
MILTKKQTQALDVLEDNTTKELVFGGGAGSAKSFLGAYWLLKMCLKYPETRWLMGRKKLKTLKETTLNSFLEVAKLQGVLIGVHFNINHQSNTIKFFNGSEILMKDLAYYPADPNFDELGSLEITGAFVDECNQLTELAWQIVKSRIRYKLDEFGLIPKIFGTCNPSKNFVYKEFYKKQKENKIELSKRFIQALVTDNPYISEHYIANLNSLPKASKERLLYGNWETDDDPNSLIQYDNILNLFENTHIVDLKTKRYITCDVARMGSDKAVIMVWQGLEVIEVLTFDVSKITQLTTTITALKNKYGVPNSHIIADEDGVGGGLVDNLKIKGFINNSKALNDEQYQNLKTQCYYKLAEVIERNEMYISAEISTMQREAITEELEQVKSTDSDEAKLKIVNKAEVKQLIGRSPDYSDALMMRMYFELAPKLSTLSQRFVRR